MNKVLVTGADGYIGIEVVKRLLQAQQSVHMWVRSKDDEEFSAKKDKIAGYLGPDLNSKVEITYGNLSDDKPFDSVDANGITHILHSAAVIRFNVEEEVADKINIDGSRKLYDFAISCPNLKQVNYLSTVYASGLMEGEIPESLFENLDQFANHYERSKNAAEKLLVNEYDDLPWNILRVATLIAEDDNGEVSQYNAVHNTLRLLYNGLISLVPGEADTTLYFVTRDFVSDSVAKLIQSPQKREIFNICHKKEESATLGELLDLVFEIFSEDEAFKAKRIMRPLLVDESNFKTLSNSLEKMSTGVVGEAMGSISPFAGQLFRKKDFVNNNLVQNIEGYRAPDIKKLISNTTKYLVKTKWGRVEL